MRITNNMMVSNMMRNLNRNMLRLDQRQMQVATGKRIHKPSDDPIAISRSLKIRADISELDQHRKNVEDAMSWLETTELATKNMGDALQRIRELSVQAANGVLTQDETFKIQNEVKELKAQIIGLSNTTYAGKYIFSGKNSDRPLLDQQGNYIVFPYSTRNPNLVDHRLKFEVGVGEMIDINILGIDVLENIVNPASLTLEFPKFVDNTTSFRLEGLEVSIEKTGEDQFSATISLNGQVPIILDVDNMQNLSSEIADTINNIIDGITDQNHPLKNYNFDSVEFRSNKIDGTEEWSIVATPQKAGLINLIETIERNMIAGNNEEISNSLNALDKFLNKLVNARSEVGAKINRMDLIHNRILDDKINFRTLQSKLEDADMGETLMELMNEENVYRASLSVGARIIQPSLLDFLR